MIKNENYIKKGLLTITLPIYGYLVLFIVLLITRTLLPEWYEILLFVGLVWCHYEYYSKKFKAELKAISNSDEEYKSKIKEARKKHILC